LPPSVSIVDDESARYIVHHRFDLQIEFGQPHRHPADLFEQRFERCFVERKEFGHVLCSIGISLEAIDASQRALPAATHCALASVDRSPQSLVSTISSVPENLHQNGESAAHSVDEPSPLARFSQHALELLQRHGLSANDFAQRGLVRGEDVLRAVNGIHGESLAHACAPAVAPVAAPIAAPTPTATASLYRSATGVPFHTKPLARSKRVEAKVLSWSTQRASAAASPS
jgi:hypothetical protein